VRVGLDFRFLGQSRAGLERGIPRFAQEQLQSVLALDRDNTYLLLCDSDADLATVRPEILAAPNAEVRVAPDDVSAFADERQELATFATYLRWLETLRLDVYHATYAAYLGKALMPGFDVCPYVATAYDLIPLVYPAQYLHDDAEAREYERRLLFVEQATRVADISRATGSDLVEHLGIAPERIDITPPAPSTVFRPVPAAVTTSVLASLDHPTRRPPRHRVRITDAYILCIAAMHYSKNLPTLIAAYSRLSSATRRRYQLDVAAALSPAEFDLLAGLAERSGIELLITGRVSDAEMVALYNGAALFVHPSHHEGFGLPVAEAMCCGTPVITTTRSALPEAAGEAAMLVDSEDAAAFTEAMELVLGNDDLRLELGQRGLTRAALFSVRELGVATLGCYAKACAVQPRADHGVSYVALWSPLPPQFSGISDYTDDLVTALSAVPGIELDLFVDDDVMPETRLMRLARVHHWTDFNRRKERAPFDATVYQVGASVFHTYMETAMLQHPGLVVLHDLQWSRAVRAERYQHDDGANRFRSELAALEGEQSLRTWDLLSGLSPVARDEAQWAFLDEHPMLGWIVDGAQRCVTLTPELAAELRERYPRMRDPAVIPMGVRDPLDDGEGIDRTVARGYLSIDPDAFLVVAPGVATPAKHMPTTMRAIAQLRARGVNALLAVVGWIPDPAYRSELLRYADDMGLKGAVRITGRISRRLFDAYYAACDTVVALRDPGLLQTSAVVMRAFAAGRSVVMSDLPSMASTPAAACIRVASPPAESAELEAALADLSLDPDRRRQLERAARAHFEAAGRAELMAKRYARLIRGDTESDNRQAVAIAGRAAGRRGRPRPRNGHLPYSKICELEDFAHGDLCGVIRDVCAQKPAFLGSAFPLGSEYRKDWEVAMAVRTLSDHGVLRPDARVLGVAAGTEDTVFYLTERCGEVVAVDRYLDPGDWTETAPRAMIVAPDRAAPYAFRRERLAVQHMDARVLRFPDESFDGIFSSGSIEHFGDLQTVAAAAYEMGRVLKPGGILTISTEALISPESGEGGVSLPGTLLLSPPEIQRYIVEASGLEPIDELDTSVSHWTRATVRDIAATIEVHHARMYGPPGAMRLPWWACWDWPHIVLESEGRRFTSVHIALRRGDRHPFVDNAWARPSPTLRHAVAQDEAATAPLLFA
jgi:glycosyltransferase involved in cell wall biosynthesis/SAM-dependent methyltransferase